MLKSKGRSQEAVGPARLIAHRNNCGLGSECEKNSLARKIDNQCDTSPATKLFCSVFDLPGLKRDYRRCVFATEYAD